MDLPRKRSSKLFLPSTTAFGARRANVLGCLQQLAVVLGLGPATFAVAGAADASPIELFVSEGCSPCDQTRAFMGDSWGAIGRSGC